MIKDIFFSLIADYTPDNAKAQVLWREIEDAYTAKGRYYHTLGHLEYLMNELNEVKALIADWNVVLFCVYYHDIVYNPLKQNNEEESALLAEQLMRGIGVPDYEIAQCVAMINATKQHLHSNENDINIFTDADLSILGADLNSYANYTMQIRKEYEIYPDMVYRPGRKKVLLHFLEMERIFKTAHFMNKYEEQARLNLHWELEQL